MSHKGNKLIIIPEKVEVSINNNIVNVKGPLGQLQVSYPSEIIKVEKKDNTIKVSRSDEEKHSKMLHGTTNANIANAINGVANGYKKVLKIVGVGYKAALSGSKLSLNIGYSHPIEFIIPKDLKVTCPIPTQIIIEGFNKVLVGEFAANVRKVRPPEPYKGKGIMYENEHIIRKVGKTAEAATGSAGAAPTKAKK